MTAEGIAVRLPSGVATVSAAVQTPAAPWAALALAHGAGTRFDHPFLVGLAGALCDAGVTTVRFNFPYSEAGRRMPGPAPHAIATWSALFGWLSARHDELPLFAAGRSYGGRMASMAAAEGAISPAGLVYLGYPLHPPGRPDRLRVAHLPEVAGPQLFVSGRTDPFVDPHDQLEEAVRSCRDASLVWVDGGHSFEVKGRRRPADEIGADAAPVVLAFLRRLSG